MCFLSHNEETMKYETPGTKVNLKELELFYDETIEEFKAIKKQKSIKYNNRKQTSSKRDFVNNLECQEDEGCCDKVKIFLRFCLQKCSYSPVIFILICSLLNAYFSQALSITLSLTLCFSVTGLHFTFHSYFPIDEND